MIIVTGGAGFIGSAMVWKLNELGRDDILIVDNLHTSEKWKNLVNRRFSDYLHKDEFLQRVCGDDLPGGINAIIHMGACSATTELDADYLMENNYRYTLHLAQYALAKEIRFLYASSAATYGDGRHGYDDADTATPALQPLNMYGYSKHLFDLWALRTGAATKMAGLKFFNVFGPNEYHKGDMASVLYKAFGQIGATGKLKLFMSDREDYADGEQKRDFVYVKDCVDAMAWLLENPEINGIYNLGTGSARTWNDLARAVFAAMDIPEAIEYIPMPEHLRGKYQYFTEAKMDKLRAAGWNAPTTSLEDAAIDYVRNHLATGDAYL